MDTARRTAITALLLVLLASPGVQAGDLHRAKAHFARAETLYRLGKFAEALSQY